MRLTTLHTDRLLLRVINSSDLKAIHELHSMPETDRYNALGIPLTLQETQTTITPWILEHQKEESKGYTFAIKAKNGFVGLICIRLGNEKYQNAEVWYKLHKRYWGKGYATEALRCIFEFGFKNLGLHRIEAGCAVANIGSVKVLEKVGMTCEGRKRKALPLESGWSDTFEYAILDSELFGTV